jgi:hypothetical protein
VRFQIEPWRSRYEHSKEHKKEQASMKQAFVTVFHYPSLAGVAFVLAVLSYTALAPLALAAPQPVPWSMLVVAIPLLAFAWVCGEVRILRMRRAQMALRGLYAIRNRRTRAEYVGCTSVTFMSRWGRHIRNLERGQHENPRLQEDWRRYGRAAFEFVVLAVMDDDAAIVAAERQLLEDRAQRLPPMLNYNVNHSRVRPIVSLPESSRD